MCLVDVDAAMQCDLPLHGRPSERLPPPNASKVKILSSKPVFSRAGIHGEQIRAMTRFFGQGSTLASAQVVKKRCCLLHRHLDYYSRAENGGLLREGWPGGQFLRFRSRLKQKTLRA